jgi:hypothetical protein
MGTITKKTNWIISAKQKLFQEKRSDWLKGAQIFLGRKIF